MPVNKDWMKLDALGHAAAVARGDVRASELVEQAIAHIERLNPRLNAVVSTCFDQALDEAKTIDTQLAKSAPTDQDVPSFLGVPFLIKDLTYVKGLPATLGSRFLKDNIAQADSKIVEKFRRAGLVVVGMSNTSELGILPTTEPLAHGPTRNPWNQDRTPGGSSGGAAAAVASGMTPIAHASDGGGSIRIPASCCGLFGYKATRGLTPGAGPFGLGSELIVSRSVRDSAAMLDIIWAMDPDFPFFKASNSRSFLDAVEKATESAQAGEKADKGTNADALSGSHTRKLRIGWTVQAPNGAPIDRACVEAVERAAALCAELGYEVEEASPSFNLHQHPGAFMVLWAANCAANVDALLARYPQVEIGFDGFEPLTQALYRQGKKADSSQLVSAMYGLSNVRRAMFRFFETYDFWLTPTLAQPPVPLGTFDPDPKNPLEAFDRTNAFVPFTPIANIAGVPAASIPLHLNEQGLPVGCQFFAPFGEDVSLLQLAARLEAAQPWFDRLPQM